MMDNTKNNHELSTQARNPIPNTNAHADNNSVAEMPNRLLMRTANNPNTPKISPGNEVRNPKAVPPMSMPWPISSNSGPTELAAARRFNARASTEMNINPKVRDCGGAETREIGRAP